MMEQHVHKTTKRFMNLFVLTSLRYIVFGFNKKSSHVVLFKACLSFLSPIHLSISSLFFSLVTACFQTQYKTTIIYNTNTLASIPNRIHRFITEEFFDFVCLLWDPLEDWRRERKLRRKLTKMPSFLLLLLCCPNHSPWIGGMTSPREFLVLNILLFTISLYSFLLCFVILLIDFNVLKFIFCLWYAFDCFSLGTLVIIYIWWNFMTWVGFSLL